MMAHHDVFQLEVAVNDSQTVQVLYRAHNLEENLTHPELCDDVVSLGDVLK